MVHFGEFLKNLKFAVKTVLPDRSLLIGQKLVENAKNLKISNVTFLIIFKHCDFLLLSSMAVIIILSIFKS